MSPVFADLAVGQEIGNRTIDWIGDPAAVIDYQTRFTKPVLVTDTTGTDEPGAVIQVTGAVGALDAEAGTARIDLTVVAAGQKVLMKSQAVVKLS